MSEPTKRCCTCKIEFPATPEYFHKKRSAKDGLVAKCKTCAIAYAKQHYQKDSTAIRIRRKERYWEDPEKARAATRDYINANKERVNASQRARHRVNPEKKRAADREYGKRNRDKIRASQKKWESLNPERKRATGNRYRSKKENLPSTLTAQEWIDCLAYWDGCCAFCGRPQGLWHKIIQEHWIPISWDVPNNPGTVVTNILPACHGVDGCNNSKWKHDPIEWLTRRLGEAKAKKKLAEITAYFEWVQNRK